MPVNIDEIKKLPDEEKLKIIEELWESIEDDWAIKESEESDETMRILEERQEIYERGEMKFSPLDEAMERLKKNLEEKTKGEENE